jgi:hypothetical protein
MAPPTIEGWRIRRRPDGRRLRPRRAVVVGDTPPAIEVARSLIASRLGEVVLSAATQGRARLAAEELDGAARTIVGLDGAAPADVLVVCDVPGAPSAAEAAGSAALWAARSSPDAAIVLMTAEGEACCSAAARRSGLPPWLILAPGGIPTAEAEQRRLARRLRADGSQISVPVIGGAGVGWRPVKRYTAVAGIPVIEACLGEAPDRQDGPVPRPGGRDRGSLVASGVALARAVLQDRRRVLSCCAWVDGRFGITGAFVSLPVPVGSRGAEDPLPMKLTLEERAFLQSAAVA